MTLASSSITFKHGVLDDSSFAAVSASDGSRYIFFQDVSGALRQDIYSQSTQSWTRDISNIIPNTTDARSNTPLSATIGMALDGSDQVTRSIPFKVLNLIIIVFIDLSFLYIHF